MGFFDFLKKKEEWVDILSPLNGHVIKLEEVPDEAFAQKMVGDGCAIEPAEGAVYAPIDAEIDIFDTNHAVSFETPQGLEMIVHFGIDSVKLKGEGFKRIATPGEVKAKDKLVEYDLDFIKANVPSTRTPVIINNMDEVEAIDVVSLGKDVKAGDLLMRVKLKK